MTSSFIRSALQPRQRWLSVCLLISVCTFYSIPLPAKSVLGRVFGSHVNDVASKVRELPASSRDSVLYGLDFSPDGSRIAVGAEEGVAIWDWRHSHLDKTLELPKGLHIGLTTNPLRYSPDGKFLAICGEGARGDVVRIWNTSDWSIAKDIMNFEGWGCTALGFSTDGRTIFTLMDSLGGKGEQFIVNEVGTWRKLWGHTFPYMTPVSLAISPDGRLVAIGGLLLIAPSPTEVPDPVKRFQQSHQEPHIYLLDLQREEVLKDVQVRAMGPITWSSDGSRIAVAGLQRVEMFDTRADQLLVDAELPNSAHMHVVFSPDGRFFVESDMNARDTGLGVHIWDSERQKLLQTMPDNADSIAVSRDAMYLAVGVDGHTTIWQFN